MSNSPICVDANVVLRFVLSEVYAERIAELWATWRSNRRPVAAPTLFHYEICSVLHRYCLAGKIAAAKASETLEAVYGLGITLHGDANLHRHALLLAGRFALPAAYDAHYVALAERLGAELWTADRRLAQAVSAALPWVHYIGE